MEQTCQEIQAAIDTQTAALKQIKIDLDTHYKAYLENKVTVDQIAALMKVEDHLEAELARLQTQQRRQSCTASESSNVAPDTYTMLAGAAVRKKSNKAKERMTPTASAKES
jgi:hypothetical protein